MDMLDMDQGGPGPTKAPAIRRLRPAGRQVLIDALQL